MSPPSTSGGLRWRPRTYLLLAAGAISLLGGVVVRNPVPLFLALPLLIAPAAAGLAGPRGDPETRLEWGEAGDGANVTISGRVTPRPGVRADDLVVTVVRPPGLAERAPPTTTVESGAVVFCREWLAAEPTIAIVPPPSIIWRDPAGLVEREAPRTAAELVVVRYPPELTRLHAVRLDRTTVLPGETLSRRLGATGEFFAIRDAAPGDPPRRINWVASARAGRLLANEYALERTGDVLLVLDARPTELGPEVDEHLLSIGRAAAEGIAESFLRSKARVGLGVYGEFLDVVPLSTGRTQRLRLRSALSTARLATTAGPSERCGIAMRRFFPPGVTTILISPLADEPALTLVPHLRRRGFPLVVLSPSPIPLLKGPARLSPEDRELSDRLTRLLRRAEILRTWNDAPTVDWSDFGSLGGFVEFLRRPAPRRFA